MRTRTALGKNLSCRKGLASSNNLFSHIGLVGVVLVLLMLTACAGKENSDSGDLILIEEQGSFSVGGTVTTAPGTFDPYDPTPAGQTFRGDHAYVFYQIPANARKYPLVMWHGFGQFSKTWETTPDGREGYQNIFLRRRFPVYLLDQPRRGDADLMSQWLKEKRLD